jgi:hypothetical protein
MLMINARGISPIMPRFPRTRHCRARLGDSQEVAAENCRSGYEHVRIRHGKRCEHRVGPSRRSHLSVEDQ